MREEFKASYPNLHSLLASWFADEENSDEEILEEYLGVKKQDVLLAVVNEGKDLVENGKKFHSKIDYISNREFESEKEACDWILKITGIIEQSSEKPSA